MEPEQPAGDHPGLKEFLKDASLSGDVTQEEVEFLKRLRVEGKRPVPLYRSTITPGIAEP
jgi:hypothetical protein